MDKRLGKYFVILFSTLFGLCRTVFGKGIGAKFDAFGWNVIDVADGNDVEQILGARAGEGVQGQADLPDPEHGKGAREHLCRAVRRTFFAADQGAVG